MAFVAPEYNPWRRARLMTGNDLASMFEFSYMALNRNLAELNQHLQ